MKEELEDLGKDVKFTIDLPEEKPEPVQETEQETAASSLQELREQVKEDEDEEIRRASLGKLLGGDILTSPVIRRQVWLFLMITGFLVVYIATRYSYQNLMIDIDKLNAELKDVQYNALSMRSELTEQTRQSKILDLLEQYQDTTLHISDRPPYKIEVPQK